MIKQQIEPNSIMQDLTELIKLKLNEIGIDDSQLSIKYFFSPHRVEKNHFGVIVLQNQCAGLIYTSLSDEYEKGAEQLDQHKLIGKSAVQVLTNLLEHKRTALQDMICMGLINALSDTIMTNLTLDTRDYQTDSFDLLNLKENDHVGMVGFFPPVVKKIEQKQIHLTIIEKKRELLQPSQHWQVTLDPKKLMQCNKVIITATTVLNNSLDTLLSFCKNAEMRMLIGPTAGFLPEPLFARNIDIIGGSRVKNLDDLIEKLKKDEKWGNSVEKYCIVK